jgi:hypothetical protein
MADDRKTAFLIDLVIPDGGLEWNVTTDLQS